MKGIASVCVHAMCIYLHVQVDLHFLPPFYSLCSGTWKHRNIIWDLRVLVFKLHSRETQTSMGKKSRGAQGEDY